MKKTSLQNGGSGCTFKYDKHKGGCINQTFARRQKQNKHHRNNAGIQSTQLIAELLDESVQILYQGIHMNHGEKKELGNTKFFLTCNKCVWSVKVHLSCWGEKSQTPPSLNSCWDLNLLRTDLHIWLHFWKIILFIYSGRGITHFGFHLTPNFHLKVVLL